MKLTTTARKGNNLETLRALRQVVAAAIEKSENGAEIATLSRQFQTILARIEELEAVERTKPQTALDTILQKRQEKQHAEYMEYCQKEEEKEKISEAKEKRQRKQKATTAP